MEKSSRIYKITTFVCLGMLFVFLGFIGLRIVVKNVVYEKLGIYNAFVAFMLEGDNAVTDDEDMSKPVVIDWESIYPFAREDLYVAEEANSQLSLVDRYENKISAIKAQIEWYTTDGLPMQTKLTELAMGYESLIGWKVQEQDYDAVITLKNGHLTCVCPDYEYVIGDIMDSITTFKGFLEERDINLMYVMVPFKIGAEDEQLPFGLTDASNANADKLIEGLAEAGVDYIDLRANEVEDGINHYDLFYYTDHHWTSRAAIWACDKVAKELNEKYGYDYDSELFNIDNYKSEIYEDVFLGSYGRRVTLSKASPEDFEIMYPLKDMTFNLKLPEKNIDATGTFGEVFIDYSMLEITDYYEMDAYSSFVTLRKYVAVITNENAQNPDKKILILRDSFGNNFGAYFAQQYGTVELVDVSDFTGSIKSYIEESKPDTVLLLYNPTMIEPIDYSSYNSSKYDFR